VEVPEILIPPHPGRSVLPGQVLVSCPETIHIELYTFFCDPTEDLTPQAAISQGQRFLLPVRGGSIIPEHSIRAFVIGIQAEEGQEKCERKRCKDDGIV
jgi:hypothetical protein